jgi:hypothetical protein
MTTPEPARIPKFAQPRPLTCDRLARKGTGVGMCDRPLDKDGYCDRAGDHLEDEFS